MIGSRTAASKPSAWVQPPLSSAADDKWGHHSGGSEPEIDYGGLRPPRGTADKLAAVPGRSVRGSDSSAALPEAVTIWVKCAPGGGSLPFSLLPRLARGWRYGRKPAPAPPQNKGEIVAPAESGNTIQGKIRPQHVIGVAATVPGFIEALLVDPGQDVFEGQVLARIGAQGLESNRESAAPRIGTRPGTGEYAPRPCWPAHVLSFRARRPTLRAPA